MKLNLEVGTGEMAGGPLRELLLSALIVADGLAKLKMFPQPLMHHCLLQVSALTRCYELFILQVTE